MAELNELTVRNDTLIQGDAKINGKTNNVINIYDNDTIIIDVYKTIDMTTTGVKLSIDIPSGYVADCMYGNSSATVGVNTYPSTNGASWKTSPTLKTTYTNAQNNTSQVTNTNISNVSANSVNIVPFIKGTITFEVSNVGSGTQVKGVIITRIICRKQ